MLFSKMNARSKKNTVLLAQQNFIYPTVAISKLSERERERERRKDRDEAIATNRHISLQRWRRRDGDRTREAEIAIVDFVFPYRGCGGN